MNQARACHVPLNEEGVDRVLESISDPATRNLVRLAVSRARMRFMREVGIDDQSFEARLPASPFDMAFFAGLMKDLFSQWDLLEKVAGGESIAGASGWNV